MAELKPCPFCGGKAEVCEDGSWYWEWEVHCLNDIRHRIEYYHTEKEAIEAWNRRVEDGNT